MPLGCGLGHNSYESGYYGIITLITLGHELRVSQRNEEMLFFTNTSSRNEKGNGGIIF